MNEPDRSVLPIPDARPATTRVVDARDVVRAPLRPGPSAPAGAPNVVVVLLDDMGFGASSAFGGPCAMPAADRLARDGLRYNRFHTTALCSPTRQSLMTGRNHHAVNMGAITHMATSVPGYTSVRPNTAVTIADVLRLNGYNTGAFGKMHQTPPWEVSASGPFDRWPTGEGFERFYGFVGGEANQWSPLLHDGTTPVDPPDDPDYHLSVDLTDKAIDWVRSQRVHTPDKPFFLYLSYGATHAPHHVPAEWIEKYRGRFDAGWDAEREAILARQKAQGVVPQDCELTERHAEIPAWAELDEDERRVAARLMEAYAAFAEHTDHQVGRLVSALEEAEALDDTLFLYILGDNGASAEGGVHGTANELASLNGVHDDTASILEVLDEIGGPSTYNHYPAGWAHATNTPFQWTKQVASHWGGTRVGMIAHWPAAIPDPGAVRSHWQHVIDVYPTVLDVAGLPTPREAHGVTQQPVDGTSFAASLRDSAAPDEPRTQYFEMFGNRGCYHHGWSACTKHATPWDWQSALPAFDDDTWELYAPDDWSQSRDLASTHPERLAELQAIFLDEAERNHVLPLDDRRVERFNAELAGRPDLLGSRRSITLHAGSVRLAESAIPNVKNKSHQVTAEVTIPVGGATGVILSQGGRFGGWCFHVRDRRLVYSHNWLGKATYEVQADGPLPEGRHRVAFRFGVDSGPGYGAGGNVDLLVDDDIVARGHVERTVPFHTGSSTSTDVGCDLGSGVVRGYDSPRGRFTGRIDTVTVTADPRDVEIPAPVRERIEQATQ